MKENREDNRLRISIILKSVIIGYAFSLICFLVLAALITFTGITERFVPLITQTIVIIALAITGANAAIRAGNRGWLYGIITGALYIIIFMLVSWIAIDGFTFDKFAVFRLILGTVVGAIGGMIGINLLR